MLVDNASAWETSTKYRLGKLSEATQAVDRFQELIGNSRMAPLPITVAHVLLAGDFSVSHRDPVAPAPEPAFEEFDQAVIG